MNKNILLATDFPNVSWKKSSFSQGNSNCVQIARIDSSIIVGDTKDQQGVVLSFTQQEWKAFVAGVKNGEFE